MLANAVLWQATSRPARQPENDTVNSAGPLALPIGSGFSEAVDLLRKLAKRADTLRGFSIEPRPSWLAPEYAMSTFGLAPDEIRRLFHAFYANAPEFHQEGQRHVH